MAAIALGVGAYFFIAMSGNSTIAPKSGLPKELPVLTPEERTQLENSHGFQALVSYTDGGFEPAKLTIKKGETVRFTNNSSEDLWVSAGSSSGAVYPGTGKECGQSAFDSCRVLKPMHFWEFTFDIAGTWGYKNVSDTKMTGVIIVE